MPESPASHESRLFYLSQRAVNHTQTPVGVGCHSAVAREMLGHARHTSVFESACECHAQLRHLYGVGAVRPPAYISVGERLYVEHRSQHHVDTQRTALARQLVAEVVHTLSVSLASESGRRWYRRRAFEAHGETRLGVDGHPCSCRA